MTNCKHIKKIILITLLLLVTHYITNAQRMFDFVEDSITGQRIYVTGDSSVKLISKEYNAFMNKDLSNHININCKYLEKGQPLNGCFRGRVLIPDFYRGIWHRTYGVKSGGILLPENSLAEVTANFRDGVMNGRYIESYTIEDDFKFEPRIIIETNQKDGELHGNFSVIRGFPSAYPSYKEDSVYVYTDIETSGLLGLYSYRINYYAKRDTLYKTTFDNGTGNYCSFLTNGEIFRKGKLLNGYPSGIWLKSYFHAARQYSSGHKSTSQIDSEYIMRFPVFCGCVPEFSCDCVTAISRDLFTVLGVKVAIQRRIQEFKAQHNAQDSTSLDLPSLTSKKDAVLQRPTSETVKELNYKDYSDYPELQQKIKDHLTIRALRSKYLHTSHECSALNAILGIAYFDPYGTSVRSKPSRKIINS
ncbi:MAG: hypothetical protein ACK5L5_07215 [Bacteroidales bacterium]